MTAHIKASRTFPNNDQSGLLSRTLRTRPSKKAPTPRIQIDNPSSYSISLKILPKIGRVKTTASMSPVLASSKREVLINHLHLKTHEGNLKGTLQRSKAKKKW